MARAVATCPGVAELSGGQFGEIATYLPGRRVPGVRMGVNAVEVHVVTRFGVPIPEVAAQVRAACAPFTGSSLVDVYVDDLALPDPAPPSPPASPSAPLSPPTPPAAPPPTGATAMQ